MHNLLIVDDRADWRKIISDLLTEDNVDFQLTAVETDTEAIEAMSTPFAVAIIDLRLLGDANNDESGLKLALILRKLQPTLKLILVAEKPIETGLLIRALRYSGFVDFISKADIVKLPQAVTAAIAELAYVSHATQFNLFIENHQPLWLRGRGQHTISLKTKTQITLRESIYIDMAKRLMDSANFRAQAKMMGQDLYKDLFSEQLRTELKVARAKAQIRQSWLVITFETQREDLNLPFEFTYFDDKEYLVLEHPVTRLITEMSPHREPISPTLLTAATKLRILLVASNTTPPIKGVDEEIAQLAAFLQTRANIELQTLTTERATRERFEQIIESWKPDVVHYAGHSIHDVTHPENSALLFWTNNKKMGDPARLSTSRLRDLLRTSTVRLVYLSSCEGSASGQAADLVNDDFIGITDAVIAAGVPSVIGFRWPVSDERAPKFAKVFYQELLNYGSIPIATFKARVALANDDRNDLTWLSPILVHQE